MEQKQKINTSNFPRANLPASSSARLRITKVRSDVEIRYIMITKITIRRDQKLQNRKFFAIQTDPVLATDKTLPSSVKNQTTE